MDLFLNSHVEGESGGSSAVGRVRDGVREPLLRAQGVQVARKVQEFSTGFMWEVTLKAGPRSRERAND